MPSSGYNSQGNHYNTPGGKNSNEGSSYHYSNKDGSYYYKNDNGSTYHDNGKGNVTYTPPPKENVEYMTGLAIAMPESKPSK